MNIVVLYEFHDAAAHCNNSEQSVQTEGTRIQKTIKEASDKPCSHGENRCPSITHENYLVKLSQCFAAKFSAISSRRSRGERFVVSIGKPLFLFLILKLVLV